MRALAACVLLAGCVESVPGIDGTQSLKVDVIVPAEPGTPDERLDDTVRSVTIKVTAFDEDGEIDTAFNGEVEVHVQYLGSTTPTLNEPPLARIDLADGVSANEPVELPPVFGPTFLWVEDAAGDDATFATGTSPTLWYRDPFIADITTPPDETALDALEASPLQEKQVTVSGSRHGANGRLVVQAAGTNSYSLADLECQDANGTPPCVGGFYDYLTIFTFSTPRDENGNRIADFQVIDGFSGAVSEFNGLTEIVFPQTFAAEDAVVDEALLPEPWLLDETFLSNTIEMERRESSLVAVENATLCPLDDDYDTYKQWKLDIGAGCGEPINVITPLFAFDPEPYVGMVFPRVVGVLEPVNIGTFNVWIIKPAQTDHITTP